MAPLASPRVMVQSTVYGTTVRVTLAAGILPEVVAASLAGIQPERVKAE